MPSASMPGVNSAPPMPTGSSNQPMSGANSSGTPAMFPQGQDATTYPQYQSTSGYGEMGPKPSVTPFGTPMSNFPKGQTYPAPHSVSSKLNLPKRHH